MLCRNLAYVLIYAFLGLYFAFKKSCLCKLFDIFHVCLVPIMIFLQVPYFFCVRSFRLKALFILFDVKVIIGNPALF